MACQRMRVGWPKDQSQKPETNMARVTVTSKASATASLPTGRFRVRIRRRRLARFPVIRRRWIRCAPTSTTKARPRRIWIDTIGSKASETAVVEIKPRCTHHRCVLFRAATSTPRGCHAIDEHEIRYDPDRTLMTLSSSITRCQEPNFGPPSPAAAGRLGTMAGW